MVLVCNRPDMADDLLARLEVGTSPAGACSGESSSVGSSTAESSSGGSSTAGSAARVARLMPRFDAPDWDGLVTDSVYTRARDRILALPRYNPA